MLDDPRLLVVDDEEAICEGCRRIFSRQGFQVEKTSDALRGLELAAAGDYAAILLDIKMPNMDGIQFLEQLRSRKPSVPVILMTGYPSIPNAVSAVRLGAAGYVTKPFTPEEISQAVCKYVAPRPKAEEPPAAAPSPEGIQFWNESWLEQAADGTVRVGAMVARTQEAAVTKVTLPRIGEVVYQGLPLAAVTAEGKPARVVPAPISGVVVAVNDRLAQEPGLLLSEPCGAGWIASLSPTRLEDELKQCAPRRVILFNADANLAETQRAKLAALGCGVRVATNWDALAAALADNACPVLVADVSQAGAEGPSLVSQINSIAPGVKVVLVASASLQNETAYRARRIFYYAVEPFADNEIADILDAAFRPQPAAEKAPARRASNSDAIASIAITNRNGTKIRLLAAPGLLRRDEGLGHLVRRKLLDRLYPIETTAGEAKVDPANILHMALTCDRLLVLLPKDVGRLPGSLVRDTKSEIVSISGEGAGKVTTLVIQPDAETGAIEFHPRTTAMLAEHIVNDMGAY